MNNIELSLEVSDSTNPKTIRLYDTSYYYPDQVVNNYLIEILPVNKSVWLTFYVQKGFSLILNSANLKYNKPTDTTGLISLCDGIYEIKQSISPNAQVFSQFYYFRIIDLASQIYIQRNRLYNDQCKLTREEFIQNRDKLRDIEEYMNAAKWMVEECGDKDKGKEMYEFTQELLQRYTNECKCK